MGGVVRKIGTRLMEKADIDWRIGRPLNANLAEYHVPVNADIGEIDLTVVDEEDPHINVLAAKGIGEIGFWALPRRLRMRFITRRASEFGIRRLRSINWCE